MSFERGRKAGLHVSLASCKPEVDRGNEYHTSEQIL